MANADYQYYDYDNPVVIETTNKGITDAQQYTISSILLVLNDGTTFDLKNTLVELGVEEDIFSPASKGYVIITDSQGFIEKLNITGFCFVKVSFNKVGSDDPNAYDRIFRVYKVGKRVQSSRSNEQYPIYFCSEEMFLSEQVKVAKSFPNQIISDVVIKIMQEYLKIPQNKIGTIERTAGQYSFIVPNLKPFESIVWLSNYAQPAKAKYVGADMLFYENRNGFNFRSIQSMITDKIYAEYNYSPQNVKETSLNYNFRAILSYRFINTFDSLNMISTGAYANKLLSIDTLTRKTNITKFNYEEYFSKAGKLNSYDISSKQTNRLGKSVNEMSDSVFKTSFSNADQRKFEPIVGTQDGYLSTTPNVGVEVYIPNRTAQMSLINHTKIEFTVPGDPGLTVGRVVTLNIPSIGPSDNPKRPNLDKYHAGNYLITAIKHIMDIQGVYHCVCEAVKESVSSPNVPSNNNNVSRQVKNS